MTFILTCAISSLIVFTLLAFCLFIEAQMEEEDDLLDCCRLYYPEEGET